MTRYFDPKNDIAFKRLFARPENKPLLISFLNSTLHREGDDIIEDIEILPTELVPDIIEAKRSILDVRCTDKKKFQYIVEMQNRKFSSFIQRVQYYAARAYIDQLSRGDTYLQLRPVILLAILPHKIFPEGIGPISYHHTLELKTQKQYLKDLSYAFIELEKFTKSWQELKTAEDHWLYLFKLGQTLEEAPSDAPQEIQRAYETLEQYRWSEEEKEAYERIHMSIMDESDTLKTARDEGRVEGRAEGKAEGEQIGLEKGERIGLEKGEAKLHQEKVAIAKNLLAKGVSVNVVAASTGLSEEFVKSLV